MRWLNNCLTAAQVSSFGLPRDGTDQAAALLDVVNLRRQKCAGWSLDIVNILHPDQGEDKAQHTHEPEARSSSPPTWIIQPRIGAKIISAKYCEELKDRGGAAALVGGKPGGYDAAISRKDRSLGKTSDQPQKKDHGEGSRGKVPGKAREQGADGPHHDADAVDHLRSKAVEQRSGWQLSEHIGPTEAGEEIAHLHRVQGNVFGHRRSGDGKGDPVSIAEAAYGKENGDDQITDVGLLAPGQDRPAISLVSSSSSASVRSVSGGRTGPAGRPMAFIPAFTMETA